MRLLLDTHIMLWTVTASPLMPPRGARIVQDNKHSFFYSAVVIWEVAIKFAKGTGQIPMSGTELLEELQPLDIQHLPVSAAHAALLDQIPLHHHDPFDRLLVAQAKVEGLTLLTHDKKLAAYGDFVMVV